MVNASPYYLNKLAYLNSNSGNEIARDSRPIEKLPWKTIDQED